MIIDLILQFAVELMRALLVDELSGRVRKRFIGMIAKGRPAGGRETLWGLHRRNRDRLLHRLRTEPEDEG